MAWNYNLSASLYESHGEIFNKIEFSKNNSKRVCTALIAKINIIKFSGMSKPNLFFSTHSSLQFQAETNQTHAEGVFSFLGPSLCGAGEWIQSTLEPPSTSKQPTGTTTPVTSRWTWWLKPWTTTRTWVNFTKLLNCRYLNYLTIKYQTRVTSLKEKFQSKL